MPSASPSPETYGIHGLKAWAITMQVLAHSYFWLIQSQVIHLHNVLSSADYIGLVLGAFSMAVPITAGAVLRLTSTIDTTSNRIVHIPWQAMVWSMALLALFESSKHTALGMTELFFTWDALHLIAASIIITLFIGSRSIAWLWSVALTIIFITPFLTDVLALTQQPAPIQPTWPVVGIIFTTIFLLFISAMARAVWRHAGFAAIHRRRLLILLAFIGAVGSALILTTTPTRGAAMVTLGTLWPGLAVGGNTGVHIWPLFPWAGTIMLGFLIYDLIIRYRAAPWLLMTVFAAGSAMLFIFLRFYAPLFFVTFNEVSFVTGAFFNRSPAAVMLVLGAFCCAVPLFHLIARWAEKPYVVDLSRSILWIYIYQTTVLVVAARYAREYLPADIAPYGYVAFALVTSLGMPLVLKRIPFNIRLSLVKSAN
jgi:hypothetical protein